MENIIKIKKQDNNWFAQFIGPHAVKVVELFGGDTIPPPYTCLTDEDEVVDNIRKLNPLCTVTV